MLLIILGLILWTWPHVLKEYTPALAARLPENRRRALGAIGALLGIVFLVIGYRSADTVFVYAPPVWGQHVNNLLMLFSVAAFGTAHSKSRLRGMIRHPMFVAVILWGIAHLLVRGDLASILLWGGMILWAVAGWIVSNRNQGPWQRYEGGRLKSDIILAGITIVVYAVIVVIHGWLGPNPLPM
ncbi:NnrU family protein [Pseudooceanicola sp. CBS1P-1]|uniref:NnrU domain-containing protein n=1 Tax=Pseudooceanicola albus TaxID=2692189 RepID=A0A6L7G2P2_9RHOB|nr:MULTISPECIES: NnrU family protein [Pseudooceanicola]MBT9384807.1 NnrU family protein [Pseudooceanicola endophyticus]MXN18199.1 hypothetical protein [Pseudooceanicola albus]